MKYLMFEGMKISQIALGCMRISKLTEKETDELIRSAIELGINFFDHADIYGQGKSEELFGKVLANDPSLRDKIYIQTKCGICKGYYDLSADHIIDSVNNSLERLHTSYIDVLLLHRPDALMEPEVIAQAFDKLKAQGKVKNFGVSNMTPYQLALLQKHCHQPLKINQLQFNVVNAGIIDSGINANMDNDASLDHDGGALDYCRLNDILIQPWSILQASWSKGTYLDHPDYEKLNMKLAELASKYHVNKSAIALAWILRHPANMQPIVGTTSIKHLNELVQANDIWLSRSEWYQLFLAIDRMLP